MIIKVWGNRGAVPVSGPQYKAYGSGTACIEVRTKSGKTIILDAGTGLGAYACDNKNSQNSVICLSNTRLDHIQGLPLFSPFISGEIPVYCSRPAQGVSLEKGLRRIFDGILLPDIFSGNQAPDLREIKPCEKFSTGDAVVEAIFINPSGNSLAWKIIADGQTLVYSAGEISMAEPNAEFLDFMADADIALVNGHFSDTASDTTKADKESNFERWAKELRKRGVKQLVFTHFNPEFTDARIETLLAKSRDTNPQLKIDAASSGFIFDPENPASSVYPAPDCPICDFFQRAAYLSDIHSVIDALLTEAKKWGNADAGTVYLVEKDDLVFAASQNDTLFPKSAANKFAYLNARIPINKSSIAGYVAVTGSRLNIPDVYNISGECEYSFNPAFDQQNNYRTCSMLCMPLVNSKNRIIGVLQLINSMRDGKAVPFTRQMENTIFRLGSMSTIPLERSLLVTSIILRMLQTSALRDPKETAGHVYRVGSIAAEIYHHWAEKHGIEPEEMLSTKGRLRLAAMLHDVGKVGIPDAMLKKPGKLDDGERRVMQQHSALGASLFSEGINDIDRMAQNIALHHHAKWDGSGYTGNPAIPSPKGDSIPLEARITAIADVYDALVSRRCYKDAWNTEKALEILRQDAGTHFDPGLVQCFEEITDTIQAIMERYTDKQEN